MVLPGVKGSAKEKDLLFSGSGGALKYFKGTVEQANSFFFTPGVQIFSESSILSQFAHFLQVFPYK